MDPPALVSAPVPPVHSMSSPPTLPNLPFAAAAALAATAGAAAALSPLNAYPPSPSAQSSFGVTPAATIADRFSGAESGSRTPIMPMSTAGPNGNMERRSHVAPRCFAVVPTPRCSGGPATPSTGSQLPGRASGRSAKATRLMRMYDNEKYADCTVRVGPADAAELFHANRTLLARCSEVFGKMLFEQPMQEGCCGEVHIPDCSATAFRELLRCAHDMELNIHEANFVDVFQLARKYEVEELQEAVADWMQEAASTPGVALKALDAAQARGISPSSSGGGAGGSSSSCAAPVEEVLEQLLEGCLHTVTLHAEELLETGALCGLSPSTVSLLVRQDTCCCGEEHLWSALLQWWQQLPEHDRVAALRGVTPYLRFNVMSSEFFVDRVVPSGFLEAWEVVDLLSARTTGRPSRMFPEAHIPRLEPTRLEDDEEDSDLMEAAPTRLSRANSEHCAGGGAPRSGATTPSLPMAAIDLSRLSIDTNAGTTGNPPAAAGTGEARWTSKRKSRVSSSSAQSSQSRVATSSRPRGSFRHST